MPWIDEGFKAIRDDIRSLREEFHNEIRVLDAKVDDLRGEMLDRLQNQLETVNEISRGLVKLEGKIEGYMEALGTLLGPVRPAQQKRKAV